MAGTAEASANWRFDPTTEMNFGNYRYDHQSQGYGQDIQGSSAVFDPYASHPNYAQQIYTPDIAKDLDGGDMARGTTSDQFDEEPPLLEELGINFNHIRQKTLIVLNPLKLADVEVVQDTDLAGPLVFCLAFGGALLLAGKLHFGYIYGIGVTGCLALFSLLSLMIPKPVQVTSIMSTLGYCLLPMCLLSLIAAVLSLRSIFGIALTCLAVFWCSLSSSKIFVTALAMDHQRLLVAYPCALVYGVFALLIVF